MTGRKDELIPLKDAATELDYDPSSLRRLSIAGKFPAQKMGRDWFVTRGDMESFRSSKSYKPRSGRPRGKT